MRRQSLNHISWKREFGIYLLLYGIPLAVLFPGSWLRPDAEFQAAIKTRAIDFTLDHYRGAGLFTGTVEEVTFENVDHVELPGDLPWRSPGGALARTTRRLEGGQVRFHNVAFRSLLLPTGAGVRIEWYAASPRGLRMLVQYSDALYNEAASVFLVKGSRVEFASSKASANDPAATGEIEVRDADGGASAIYAAPGTRISINLTPREGPGRTSPLVEQDLPLLPGSQVSFTAEGQSAIIGEGGAVQVRNADRKEPVFQRQQLEISQLRSNSVIASLAIDNGINVALRGTAGTLLAEERDLRPSPAEYLRAQKVLSAWLTTSILIGTAALSIANRTKLIRSQEPSE